MKKFGSAQNGQGTCSVVSKPVPVIFWLAKNLASYSCLFIRSPCAHCHLVGRERLSCASSLRPRFGLVQCSCCRMLQSASVFVRWSSRGRDCSKLRFSYLAFSG